MSLIKRILKSLETTKNMDQRRLAQAANIYESALSRYLKGFEELNFESILRIVRILFPDQEKEVMIEYIYTQKSRNARYALEYCAMHHYWDVIGYLLDHLFSSSNPIDKEWATVYNLILLSNENKLTSLEFLGKIELLNTKELEMSVLKRILKVYAYYDLKEYKFINFHIIGIKELITKIKSSFIKESYSVRFGLIMNFLCLNANNLDECRKYSQSIINQDFFDSPKGNAFHHLGHSYLFEDYNKSSKYLTKALSIFEKMGQKERKKATNVTLSFLNSYWNKDVEFSLEIDDHISYSNYIYYLFKKGDIRLARKCLESVNVKEITERDKAFYYYYNGLVTNEISSYYQSVEQFLYLNDQFHAQLPMKELKAVGAWY